VLTGAHLVVKGLPAPVVRRSAVADGRVARHEDGLHVFHPARERLVGQVGKWARQQRRTGLDPFVIETLLEHRWSHGDGLLGRWHPDDLTAALLDWFPRQVTMHPDDWDAIVPSVRGFVDFLFDEGLADRHCADRAFIADVHAGRIPGDRDLLSQALEESMLVPYGGTEEQQQAWRQSAHNDADRLFAELADLGAVRFTDDRTHRRLARSYAG